MMLIGFAVIGFASYRRAVQHVQPHETFGCQTYRNFAWALISLRDPFTASSPRRRPTGVLLQLMLAPFLESVTLATISKWDSSRGECND
jgi:hypothetical protein